MLKPSVARQENGGKFSSFLPQIVMVDERWKPVSGYEGLYEVSDLGRVRRLPRFQVIKDRLGNSCHRLLKGMEIRPIITDRYLCVNLWRDGKGKTTRINILVCETFNGSRPLGKDCALHGNGDRFDNRATNLRWGDHLDNAVDREAHGNTAKGERQHSARLTESLVRSIRERVAAGEQMASIAREVGVNKSSIQAAVHRRSWGHVG